MKISYNWLKQYIDLTLSPEELKEKMTFAGIEVEEMAFLGDELKDVVVGKIVTREQHPNADKLSLCTVNDGTTDYQVVCGAPNTREGQIIAFAPVGTTLGEITLKKAKIRGVESQGMICSEREMGISDNHDGIMELPEDAPLGMSLPAYLGLHDIVYDVEITPNRSDLLGMIGIARDLAAILNIPVKLPEMPLSASKVYHHDYVPKFDLRTVSREELLTIPEIGPKRADYILGYREKYGFDTLQSLLKVNKIGKHILEKLMLEFKPFGSVQEVWQSIQEVLTLQNKAPKKCPRYTARFIKGVTVKESPEWLKKHLVSVGLRPINNIVDVTNYVMMEFGHPLHAFDYTQIEGHKIIVRTAKDGEPFQALDEEKHTLTSDDLVICDAKKPIALAGVIGGMNSQIDETTTDIVIEAANFLYSSVRKTATRLKINTDSSYRFERDISDENAILASDRAVQLILLTAGGALYDGVLDSYPHPLEPTVVALRPQKTREFLDVEIPTNRMVEILESLSILKIKEDEDTLLFRIPHYRKDITREADLIEEIIRIWGYNNVGTRAVLQNIQNRDLFYMRRRIEDYLVDRGFFEAVNWPFADPEDLDRLKIAEDDQRRETAVIMNPVGVRFSIMQTTLLPNLLRNALHNINHGQHDIKLFELNKLYFRKNEKLAREETWVCGLMTGVRELGYWKARPENLDFFDVKGIVEELVFASGLQMPGVRETVQPYLMKGQAADITVGRDIAGCFGRLDPMIAKKYDLDAEIYVFEIRIDTLLDHWDEHRIEFTDVSRFPAVHRDLSILVQSRFTVEEIIAEIRQVNAQIIRDVSLFDVFTGKQVKEDYRSLAFKLSFQSPTKTLTDDTINKIFSKIVSRLEQKFNIEMR